MTYDSMPSTDEVPRVEPAGGLAEREMLLAWIEYHRATFELKCSGLTDEQLATRSVPPSTLTLLGLLRHLTDVEHLWLGRRLAGHDEEVRYWSEENPDGDFNDLDSVSIDEAWSNWRTQAAESDRILADHTDLDEVVPHRNGPKSLRWVLTHLIEEYARHNGHADLLRECLDGARGE